jgi:glycosyltransferase involved in cell wall biosynthesis
MLNPTYVVISAVRDEADYLALTIASLAGQTIVPTRWIVVDDGSTDGTGALLDRAARDHDWIRVIHRSNRGFRKSGTGVIEAFYEGYRLIEEPPQFLVKLDGDVSFHPDYFERCLHRFTNEPDLGIGGGTISNQLNGHVVVEWKGDPPFHVRGATKIYRRECWEEIGGLIQAPGWDTLDEVKANMLGWTTRTFADIPILHHRPAGAADGTWKNWVKNGRANYVVGYHPLFMLMKCFKRFFVPPLVVGALGLGTGFATGYLQHIPRVKDPAVIRFLRRQQINRLLFRKSIWH